MKFSFGHLLVHDELVPMDVRDALKAAYAAPLEQQDSLLESVARMLYRRSDLDCGDVRELVGLSTDGVCG